MTKSVKYIILVCAVSWAAAGIAALCGMNRAAGPGYTAFAAGYMFLPAICTVILQAIDKEKLFGNLNISFRLNRWFIAAVVLPIFIAFAALGATLLLPGISFSTSYEELFRYLPAEQSELAKQQLSRFSPAVFMLMQTASAIFAGCTINAVFALGEETGWRGYMLNSLQHKKILPVSLITGAVWGLWHFPLIMMGHNYPQHPAIGIFMMTVFCILITPMMIYIVLKSKSIITAAIFHGTFNAISGISIIYLTGGSDLTNGVTGISGFAVLLLINIALYVYDKYITKENIFTKTIFESKIY